MTASLTIALISDTFFDNDPAARLGARLHEAKSQGAQLAVLPELALNPWSPATKDARDEDAEAPNGPRHQLHAQAARDVGIALIGAAIVRNPATGARHNTALVFDGAGKLLGTHRKQAIPCEPGFWESSHYAAGREVPTVFHQFGIPIGVQICSDINRTVMSNALAAMGAGAVINPRASELATYERWRYCLRALARTTNSYVLSVNRPAPEQGVLLGGPSLVVDPFGEIIAESTESLVIVELKQDALDKARVAYPGYLSVPAGLYATTWAQIAARDTSTNQQVNKSTGRRSEC
jgi:predicted amidohydrolase